MSCPGLPGGMSVPPPGPGHGHIQPSFNQPPPPVTAPPPLMSAPYPPPSHHPPPAIHHHNFAAPPPPQSAPVSYMPYQYYNPAVGYFPPPTPPAYGYPPPPSTPVIYSHSVHSTPPPPSSMPPYYSAPPPAGYGMVMHPPPPTSSSTYQPPPPSAIPNYPPSQVSTSAPSQSITTTTTSVDQDSNRHRPSLHSKELDLLLPPRKRPSSRERYRDHSPSSRRSSSHHGKDDQRRLLPPHRRLSGQQSRERRSSPRRHSSLHVEHREEDRQRHQERGRERVDRDRQRRDDPRSGPSSQTIAEGRHSRPRESQQRHSQPLPNREQRRERPQPNARLHSQTIEASSQSLPSNMQPLSTQSAEQQTQLSTSSEKVAPSTSIEINEPRAQPLPATPTLAEDRPSSPHSASSTNSGPLSPARGPSRRPLSPSNPCTTLEKAGSSQKKSSISAAVDASTEMDLKRLNMSLSEVIEDEMKVWTRSAPADLYYERDMMNPRLMRATPRLGKLLDRFEEEIVANAEKEKARLQGSYKPPKPSTLVHSKGCCGKDGNSSDSSSSDEEEEESAGDAIKNESIEWMEHRAKQSFRLNRELWDNRSQELNDGPVCRCSQKSQKVGIRHGIFPGEDKPLPELDPNTNNAGKLYHYRVTISPPTNFLVKHPTIINHDEHEFIFEGFSLFSIEPLKELPVCHVLRFSIKYSILYFEEKYPDNVTLRELQLFQRYFFNNILELVDWDVKGRFYFMPRFVRDLSENGKEILSMNEVIAYLVKSYQPIVDEMDLMQMLNLPRMEWQNTVTEKLKGMLVTNPGMAPAAIRVDQLDREQDTPDVLKFPDIVHFGTRPQQLCYAGSMEYQKTWREYVKYRHLLANMPKPAFKDKRQLEEMEERLNQMRANNTTKRDIAIAVSCQGFYKTGLMTDIVQHGLLLPVLVHHLRMHAALDDFEKRIGYTFKNRNLLQLAMTHPSYKENFGTNPDHVRNTLSNCSIRQPEYGDKRVHSATTRKRGINMLISIMSRFGKNSETESKVAHNERLEFLGDAVVEFVTSVHLFHMFPDLEEGGLATYRAALVQNQHLAVLAEALGLEHYMLYAHGSDLCHDAEMRHAMANCFEALMGAIYLDSGINEADKVFSKALFGTDKELFDVWIQMEPHPLQSQEPDGDRHWISSYPILKKLVEFELSCGIEFTHIRLLARALSDRSLGNSNLTMGSNQRLEFLGDTVLQLVTSDYLYRFFPEHHEGHLSLLRASMVNNRTQSVVCDDLDIPKYAMFSVPKKDLKMKDRADLLEAFIGALYVDKDLEYCRVFAEVCFFPRLQHFIINQEWNDPKSKLQQCCLTLRAMNGHDPDIPVYKVIESKGPTNTRVYTVAVYFRGERLAKAEGHSIQMAEMAAAKLALDECGYLFPHLNYQKRIVEKSLKRQHHDAKRQAWTEETQAERKRLGLDEINAECQRRNAERMAQIKSETSAVKNSTEHRISPERRKSLERRKSPERRISPERRKSSEHRRSLERLPGERAEKRIRLRDDISGSRHSRRRSSSYDRHERNERKGKSSKHFTTRDRHLTKTPPSRVSLSTDQRSQHLSKYSTVSKSSPRKHSSQVDLNSSKHLPERSVSSNRYATERDDRQYLAKKVVRSQDPTQIRVNSASSVAIKVEPDVHCLSEVKTEPGLLEPVSPAGACDITVKKERDEPLEEGECSSDDDD